MSTLVDQPDRDAITGQLDRTLFVEAGAGTGKTRSLIDRVVALVLTEEVPLREVAAVTFHREGRRRAQRPAARRVHQRTHPRVRRQRP